MEKKRMTVGQSQLIPHLFRTEYRKIVSVLCTRFGFGQMEAAEDITCETFLSAVQTWPLEGLPPHPVAWLYHVAKNKARNYLQREAVFKGKIVIELKKASVEASDEIDLSAANDQLLVQKYSPVAALNRTYALSKTRGKEVALVEAEKLKLAGNPYYFALLGELYAGIDDGKAEDHFREAVRLARTEADKQALLKKIGIPGL